MCEQMQRKAEIEFEVDQLLLRRRKFTVLCQMIQVYGRGKGKLEGLCWDKNPWEGVSLELKNWSSENEEVGEVKERHLESEDLFVIV